MIHLNTGLVIGCNYSNKMGLAKIGEYALVVRLRAIRTISIQLKLSMKAAVGYEILGIFLLV